MLSKSAPVSISTASASPWQCPVFRGGQHSYSAHVVVAQKSGARPGYPGGRFQLFQTGGVWSSSLGPPARLRREVKSPARRQRATPAPIRGRSGRPSEARAAVSSPHASSSPGMSVILRQLLPSKKSEVPATRPQRDLVVDPLLQRYEARPAKSRWRGRTTREGAQRPGAFAPTNK